MISPPPDCLTYALDILRQKLLFHLHLDDPLSSLRTLPRHVVDSIGGQIVIRLPSRSHLDRRHRHSPRQHAARDISQRWQCGGQCGPGWRRRYSLRTRSDGQVSQQSWIPSPRGHALTSVCQHRSRIEDPHAGLDSEAPNRHPVATYGPRHDPPFCGTAAGTVVFIDELRTRENSLTGDPASARNSTNGPLSDDGQRCVCVRSGRALGRCVVATQRRR